MKKFSLIRQAGSVRLAPAAMATVAAVLGLKAVAFAQAAGEAAQHAPASTEAPASDAPAEGAQAGAEGQACPTPSFAETAGLSQSEVQVLQALGARRTQLDERESELSTQSALMEAAQQRLDQRLAELHQLETTVNGLLGQLDAQEEQRLSSLVNVYQRMRAKDAATVFDGLQDDTLVQVAARMREQNLAEIMGKMNPARARALTQMLADRSRPPSSGADLLRRATGN